jgi:hypothetical protein
LSVTPAALTAYIHGGVQSGDSGNTFTVNSITYSHFANDDTFSVVSGTLSCSVISGPDNSGNYGIVCQGLSAANYNISYDFSNSPNSVASLPAPLIVNVNGTIQNNGTTFAISSYTFTGFVNGDTPSVVTGTLSCTVTPGLDDSGNPQISCGGLSATNYTVGFSYPSGIDSVYPAPLNVIVTEIPGNTPTFTSNYSGFVNGDLPSTVVFGSLSCTVDQTPDTAGNNPLSCSGLYANGYNITYSYSPGPVSVQPVPLTVNVTGMEYMGGAPTFTVTESGFVNGDLPTVVTGTLSCNVSSTPDSTSPGVVTYPITSCSGLSAPSTYMIYYWLGDVTNQLYGE